MQTSVGRIVRPEKPTQRRHAFREVVFSQLLHRFLKNKVILEMQPDYFYLKNHLTRLPTQKIWNIFEPLSSCFFLPKQYRNASKGTLLGLS